MALSTSPSPEGLHSRIEEYDDQLDEDIAKVRAEIQSLTRRRKLLAASLLSSTRLQAHLRPSQGDVSSTNTTKSDALVLSHIAHNEANVHRLALGVTGFPFHDPNPETVNNPLLGIRFDIPSRDGKFSRAPYYVFCQRTHVPERLTRSSVTNNSINTATATLRIHHHTLPALVPLDKYTEKYLPQPRPSSSQSDIPNQRDNDEGYYGSTTSSSPNHQARTSNNTITNQPNIPKQNLHALVSAVRNDLTSWHLRQDAISRLTESLNLPPPFQPTTTSTQRSASKPSTATTTTTTTTIPSLNSNPNPPKYNLTSLTPTTNDMTILRIIWRDDSVARMIMSNDGYVQKVVAIGGEGRLSEVETILSSDDKGDRVRVTGLEQRFEEVERRRGPTAAMSERDGDEDEVMSTTSSSLSSLSDSLMIENPE